MEVDPRRDVARAARFAMLGVAGYIAPRHLEAIRATGNTLVAACDPRDSVGVLDRSGLTVDFTTDEGEFARRLAARNRGPAAERIDVVSICSPNFVHVEHCRLALACGADAICEKPLATEPRALDALAKDERASGRRVYTVLQLRCHEQLAALRERIARGPARKHQVDLTYVTARGPWYHVSWKGDAARSGGIATNIGIHLFDLLLWLFGGVERERVHLSTPTRMAGALELQRACVRWFLSVDPQDIPADVRAAGRTTHRSIMVDGSALDFSEGFSELHTRVYQSILAGAGLGLEDARPSIELTARLRALNISPIDAEAHPLLLRDRGGG